MPHQAFFGTEFFWGDPRAGSGIDPQHGERLKGIYLKQKESVCFIQIPSCPSSARERCFSHPAYFR
jgi:hypothetical protein